MHTDTHKHAHTLPPLPPTSAIAELCHQGSKCHLVSPSVWTGLRFNLLNVARKNPATKNTADHQDVCPWNVSHYQCLIEGHICMAKIYWSSWKYISKQICYCYNFWRNLQQSNLLPITIIKQCYNTYDIKSTVKSMIWSLPWNAHCCVIHMHLDWIMDLAVFLDNVEQVSESNKTTCSHTVHIKIKTSIITLLLFLWFYLWSSCH